jgi:hypothetical protein
MKRDGYSPVCVCTFVDGEVSRLTTWSKDGTPDVRRGVRLGCFAYESRTKQSPPPITAARFERNGEIILQCTPEQIAEASFDGAGRRTCAEKKTAAPGENAAVITLDASIDTPGVP